MITDSRARRCSKPEDSIIVIGRIHICCVYRSNSGHCTAGEKKSSKTISLRVKTGLVFVNVRNGVTIAILSMDRGSKADISCQIQFLILTLLRKSAIALLYLFQVLSTSSGPMPPVSMDRYDSLTPFAPSSYGVVDCLDCLSRGFHFKPLAMLSSTWPAHPLDSLVRQFEMDQPLHL